MLESEVTPYRWAIVAIAAMAMSCQRGPHTFPERPVKVYVGFAPGGGTDVLARTVASVAPQTLGQRMIVVNLPGAAGTRAARHVARSAADGYALLVAGGSETVSVGNFKKLPYDPLTSFSPLIRMARERIVLIVRADREWKNLPEFLESAGRNPNQYTYSTAGYASIYHAAMLAVCRAADVQLQHLPCNGSGPSIAALLGGHVDLALAAPTETVALEAAGKIRCLAITSDTRTRFHPDVPTLLEFGYPVVIENQKGFVAPAGLSAQRRERLHSALKEIADSEAFQELCRKQRLEPAYLGPAEFDESIRRVSQAIHDAVADQAGSSSNEARLSIPMPSDAPGTLFFPALAVSLIAGASLLLMAGEFRRSHRMAFSRDLAMRCVIPRETRVFFALTLGAVLLVEPLGLVTAAAVYLATQFYRSGWRHWTVLAALPVMLSALLYLCFEVVMHVPLPHGPLGM